MWSYGSLIYNYLCNWSLLLLTLWVWILLWRGVLNTTLCDKVYQWLSAGHWFSLGTKRIYQIKLRLAGYIPSAILKFYIHVKKCPKVVQCIIFTWVITKVGYWFDEGVMIGWVIGHQQSDFGPRRIEELSSFREFLDQRPRYQWQNYNFFVDFLTE